MNKTAWSAIEADTTERMPDIEAGRRYIRRHFGQLRARWRTTASAVSFGYDGFDGHATHAERIDPAWFSQDGDQAFCDGAVPDGLWAVGLQNGGLRESLIALWCDGGRRFWFNDAYVVFTADSQACIATTRAALRAALARWDRGEPRVTYGAIAPAVRALHRSLS